jgi:hypothetical protein
MAQAFFVGRCSPDYILRNVNKMAAWIADNKKIPEKILKTTIYLL